MPLAEEVNRIAVEGIPPENITLMRETLLQIIENLAADESDRG